jgi:hypothetical protein
VCELEVDVNILKRNNLKILRFLKEKKAEMRYNKPVMTG